MNMDTILLVYAYSKLAVLKLLNLENGFKHFLKLNKGTCYLASARIEFYRIN